MLCQELPEAERPSLWVPHLQRAAWPRLQVHAPEAVRRAPLRGRMACAHTFECKMLLCWCPVLVTGKVRRMPATALQLKVWGVPQKCVPAMVDVGHPCVDNVYNSWRTVVKGYVQTKQEAIAFGSHPSGKMDEVEVDEAVIRKTELGDNQVQWHEAVGLKRRGGRKSLFISKRPAAGGSAATSCRDSFQTLLQDRHLTACSSQ